MRYTRVLKNAEVTVRSVMASFVGALVAAGMLALVFAATAGAHGIEVEQRTGQAVEVIGGYDNGDPMVEGQVIIHAPDQPDEPWMTGISDEDGRFIFMPDRPGTWEVQVVQAGHGSTVPVEVAEETAATGDTQNGDSGAGSEEETAAGQGDESADEGGKAHAEEAAGTGGESAAITSGYSTPQMVLMGALGLWGFVGTALFFRRKAG